ncbi:hypothetical protein XENOCAPTIV_010020 [Xenoophorus captivus]|uniref:ATP synthase subunit b n=1 Tax=Xenoophorus captivus TaxID=1517983 RepID=A0ABV0RKD6_9TELE
MNKSCSVVSRSFPSLRHPCGFAEGHREAETRCPAKYKSALHSSNMLSRLVFLSAGSLKGSGPIGAGLIQASRSLQTSSQSLAPVPPLPEKGGKVRHGLIPEELFQLLYPKTGVTDWETAPLGFIETARLCRELLWDNLLLQASEKKTIHARHWASRLLAFQGDLRHQP